jgi:parallel beta-helix repeat protein
MLTLAFIIQPVRAQGTIYIRADGSIDPPTAPISTLDNVTYTLTGNITVNADAIVIERDNIVVDGAGNYITPNNCNGIILSERSNVTIKNTNIQDCWYGIYLNSSSNNSISGNNITPNTPGTNAGIRLEYSSDYNNISGNNLTTNSVAIRLWYSSNYNSISGNSITANAGGIELGNSSNYNSISGNNLANNWEGISLYFSSDYNNISGNNVTNAVRGFWINSCSNNSISGNNITSCGQGPGQGGIVAQSSVGNRFFHNNFVNNNPQVYYYTTDCADLWDDGYPSGGNYWSDYNSTDAFKGPYQNETGSDGIGDRPYFIDSNNTDRYPLMNLWVPLPSAPVLVPLLDTFVTVMEPSTLGWDAGIGAPCVIYEAGLYKMWYWAFDQPGGFGRRVIAYAESNDGITWSNNQVVHDAGSGYYSIMSPWVVKEGGTYRMWHADYFDVVAGDWSFYIAHMTSTDGISWPAFMSADDQKVLSAQGQDNLEGDGYDIMFACVVHESAGYVMWYTVFDHPQPGVSGPPKIWRATSTDGITWSNRQLSLPYIPDTWEGSVVHASVVKEDDGTYTMFYAAGGVGVSSIGIAQSSDGISWVNRTQLLKSSDLGANITGIGDPFHFTDVNGDRYLYFTYYDGESKLGRIQLGAFPHDVAITNITPSETVVGQGYSLNINVTVANQGDYAETFNVTAYANTTIIASQNVTLTAGNSTTVTFTWNTAGFAYGNYALSAYAWPVPGETDTSNNLLVGGQVLVSIRAREPVDVAVTDVTNVDGVIVYLSGMLDYSDDGFTTSNVTINVTAARLDSNTNVPSTDVNLTLTRTDTVTAESVSVANATVSLEPNSTVSVSLFWNESWFTLSIGYYYMFVSATPVSPDVYDTDMTNNAINSGTVSVTVCREDVTGEGIVNMRDIAGVISRLNRSGPPGWIKWDVIPDGYVDYFDIQTCIRMFNSPPLPGAITWNLTISQSGTINVYSNYIVYPQYSFNVSLKQLSFNVTSSIDGFRDQTLPSGRTLRNDFSGFCNVTIPNTLMHGDFIVYLDDVPISSTVTSNETCYFVYFDTTALSQKVRIVSEYSAILGDINLDGIVDIYDAIILAGAYNSGPGEQNWNPSADINGDGTVDIYDAIILAGHYNQHYP